MLNDERNDAAKIALKRRVLSPIKLSRLHGSRAVASLKSSERPMRTRVGSPRSTGRKNATSSTVRITPTWRKNRGRAQTTKRGVLWRLGKRERRRKANVA